MKMNLWYNILLILLTNFNTNAEILIDSDGGYKNIIVGISPNLKLDIESVLSQLKALFRNTSQELYTASRKNVFFKEISFAIPKEYRTRLTTSRFLADGSDSKSFRRPDVYVTENDVFEKTYTVQHRGCGQPGLRINIPNDFLMSSDTKKATWFLRQWAHYRYGVFSESGFSNDEVYPACYRVPGSDEMRVSDCTNEKAIYESETENMNGRYGEVCLPVPASGKNDHIISSVMTSIDFPKVNSFCDDDTRPHNRNSPTKQNALCREKSTWEVISSHNDFKFKSKTTSNVKPAFKYIVESEPNFAVAVDTSSEMNTDDRMIMTLNAFSYFIFYDLPDNSTVRLIDMTNDGRVIEKNIMTEDDARWLIGMFPEIGKEGDVCVHCTIQKIVENNKLDIKDLIVITATDITSSNVDKDNIVAMLKSNRVSLHVIYFGKKVGNQISLERIAKSSGGSFFCIPESFPPGSSVSQITVLYEAFRSIYESFSWTNRKRALVDQMTFTNNCSPKCLLSFPSDHSIQTLQVIITGTEFGRDTPIFRNSIVLDNGMEQFVNGNNSFIYKTEAAAYVITVQDPLTGKWNLTFERKPGFNKPVVVIVRATVRDYGDIINMQSWISTDDKNVEAFSHPPITIYSEVKKHNRPVIDAEVTASIHQASYNKEWLLELKDSGDGDPDITRNDGIYSRYLTDIDERGYHSITVVAEKKYLKYYESLNAKSKENHCCGSFIPEDLSYNSGYFKRVVTYQSFYVSGEKAGRTYPPRRVVDLRIERIEIYSGNIKCYVLKWTAPGDNYDKGKAFSYDIKIFKTRIDALSNFQNSSILSIGMLNIHGPLLEPQEAGTIQTALVELTNLTNGIYYLAMKTMSHSGKISDVSNVVELKYTEQYPFTGTGFSKGDYYTFPIDPTDPTSEDKSTPSNFGLAIGLTCGILLLLIIIGFVLLFYFGWYRKDRDKSNAGIGQNAKVTESNDALCRSSGDGNISIISPVTSWGANSLVSQFETLQKQKTGAMNGTVPENRETDSVSLTSSKYSYDNKIEQNSTIYDPIYYHQVRSQDELNYSYNPGYTTPFDPVYTSSLRRLDNSNIIDNPYCPDNISYCSYSLNRTLPSRLKTDV